MKICTLCKKEKQLSDFYLKRNIVATSRCKDCIKKERAKYVLRNLDKTRKLSSEYYYKYRRNNLKSEYRDRCFKTGLDGFLATVCKSCLARKGGNIDRFYLKQIWDDQNGLCAISGIPMTYISGLGKVPTNVSIDRIDCKKPYIKDNVRLTCVSVNIMRGILTDEQLLEMCNKIIKNYAIKKR